MKFKQLSLFLENRPGELSRPVHLLAKAKINILTLSVADARQFGVLRLIVKDWEKALKLLESNHFVVHVTDMVAIDVEDHPGGLAKVLEAIEESNINVEYMYAFAVKREHKGMLVFRFNDPDKAIAAFQKQHINVIGPVEFAQRLGA